MPHKSLFLNQIFEPFWTQIGEILFEILKWQLNKKDINGNFYSPDDIIQKSRLSAESTDSWRSHACFKMSVVYDGIWIEKFYLALFSNKLVSENNKHLTFDQESTSC